VTDIIRPDARCEEGLLFWGACVRGLMPVARSPVVSSKEKVRNEDEWTDNVSSGLALRTRV